MISFNTTKDLENDFLESQIKLNENLELQVQKRTSELTNANHLIIENPLIHSSLVW